MYRHTLLSYVSYCIYKQMTEDGLPAGPTGELSGPPEDAEHRLPRSRAEFQEHDKTREFSLVFITRNIIQNRLKLLKQRGRTAKTNRERRCGIHSPELFRARAICNRKILAASRMVRTILPKLSS